MLPFFVINTFLGAWGRKASWRIVRLWAYIWFPMVGIFNKNIFEEVPDSDEPYIVVANHVSYLDTPVIFRSIPFPVRPLAAAEYAKIPLFGILYKHLAVTIDRSNLKSKKDGIRTLRKTLNRDGSIFIFPEGKFNLTEEILTPFYDGAFKIAVQANTKILPLLFLDTNKRWNNKCFWNLSAGKNRVVYLPVVDPEDYENNVSNLKNAVYQQMTDAMIKYQNA